MSRDLRFNLKNRTEKKKKKKKKWKQIITNDNEKLIN